MKINLDDQDSKIIKQNETYTLIDNTYLNGLIVSKAILHPEKIKVKKKYISLLVVTEQ